MSTNILRPSGEERLSSSRLSSRCAPTSSAPLRASPVEAHVLGRFFGEVGEVSRSGHSRATLLPLLSSILFVNSHVNRVDRLGAPKLALHPQAQCIRHLLLVCAARRALGGLRNKSCFTLWSQFVLETHEAAAPWVRRIRAPSRSQEMENWCM